MQGDWDRKSYLARIKDRRLRQRHQAASPDETDIACYRAALEACASSDVAVVLGMTPELRALASRHFSRVISAERDPVAVDMFREWLDEAGRGKEEIILTDWMDLDGCVPLPVSAVLGDGVFGNLADVESHLGLLLKLRKLLRPDGRLVTRMAFIPRGFQPDKYSMQALLQRFRGGTIDEAEFGFGTRLVGHYGCCYDLASFTLDNKKLFAECHEAFLRGMISRREHDCIERYFFGGKNCIVTQDVWEQLLQAAGFGYSIHKSTGKEWRDYYVVYECFPLQVTE